MHCACGLVAVPYLVHRARADVLQLRPRRAPRRYGYTAGAALISRKSPVVCYLVSRCLCPCRWVEIGVSLCRWVEIGVCNARG